MEIERGIAVPLKRGRKPKYPWRQMEIGDSFFVPGPTVCNGSKAWAEKTLGIKIVMRSEDNGRRFFRVA
jgi:hypothetical protein